MPKTYSLNKLAWNNAIGVWYYYFGLWDRSVGDLSSQDMFLDQKRQSKAIVTTSSSHGPCMVPQTITHALHRKSLQYYPLTPISRVSTIYLNNFPN